MTSPDPLIGFTLGPYEILDRLGAGASATVYRAKDTQLGREIALKVFRGKEFEQAFRESKTASHLDHPNIVRLFSANSHYVREDREHYSYIAMELVEGPSLAERLKQAPPLKRFDALWLVQSVAEALKYAHGEGVIHRDIKPSNIMIAPGSVAKLTDFGVADVIDATVTQSKTEPVGTPAYISPEALDHERASPASDVFALGVVLYECLTGENPFRLDSRDLIYDAIRKLHPPPLQTLNLGISSALSAVVERAMAKDPTARYQSADDFLEALYAVGDEPSVERREFLRLGSIAGIVLAGVVGWSVYDRLGGEEADAPGDSDPPAPEPSAADGRDRRGSALTADSQPSEETAETTFLVMGFDAGIDGSLQRLGQDLQKAFAGPLNDLVSAKTVSSRYLRFVMEKGRMGEIEAMRELGVRKMVSGTITPYGDKVWMNVHFLDVGLEKAGSELFIERTGPPESAFELLRSILLEAIERLNLPISEEERSKILRRKYPKIQSLQLLLDSEHGVPREEVPGPSSKLRGLRELATLVFGLPAAHAAESDPDAEIRELLERYRLALEGGDVEKLATVYADYDDERRAAQTTYFESVEGLRVAIRDVEIVVFDDEGMASFTREDQFVDGSSGKDFEMVVRLTKPLRRTPDGWRIVLED